MLETRHTATRTAPFPLAKESLAGVTIEPLAPRTRLSLRLRPAEAARVGAAAGLAFDVGITGVSEAAGRRAVRLGPDEWLILGHADETEELAARIASDLEGVFHSLVDVSHRNCGLLVRGPAAEATLNAGCPLDLAPSAFPVGTATRTVFAKAEILLARVEDDAFEVECWRSFATYVRGFLVEAARGL